MKDKVMFDTILKESSVNDGYMIESQREWKHKRPTWIQHLIFFSISLLSTIILVSAGHVRLTDIFKGKVGTGPNYITEIARVILFVPLAFHFIPVINWISCKFSRLMLIWLSYGLSRSLSHPSLRRYFVLHMIMVLSLLIKNVAVIAGYGGKHGPTSEAIEFFYDFMNVIERFCIALFQIGVFLGWERVLVEKIKISVHRIALLPRIQPLNAMFKLLSKWYCRVAGISKNNHVNERPLFLEEDEAMPFRTSEDIVTVAHTLFGDQDKLKLDELSKIVGDEDANELYCWLGNSNTILNKEVALSKLKELRNERQQAWKQLQRNDSTINKLHVILQFVFFIVGTFYAAPTLGFAKHRAWMVYVMAIAALVVNMFKDVVKTDFEAFIFLFVRHPYDVGDEVYIDGTKLRVTKVEPLYTHFANMENGYLMLPNSHIMDKKEVNYTRQRNQIKLKRAVPDSYYRNSPNPHSKNAK